MNSNNFLASVILRVDFSSPNEELKFNLSQSVNDICLKYFPIPQKVNLETQEVVISNDPNQKNTVVNSQKTTEWHFLGNKLDKKMAITHQCMFFDFKKYESFSIFKNEFFEIFKCLQTAYPEIKINRIGLRYIDKIDLTTEKTKSKTWKSFWVKYIDKNLLSALDFINNDKIFTRFTNVIEMNYEEYMLRFQYGIVNNDFPAPNKKKIFVLDTDVFATGLYETGDVETIVDEFHEKAIEWFKKSIKEKLYIRMEQEHE